MVKTDYVRVITKAELHGSELNPGEQALQTPLGGCVIAAPGSTTYHLLCQFLDNPGAAFSRILHEPLLEVPAGLKAEMLYYVADSAAAYKILESSQSAREYVLSLTYIGWDGVYEDDEDDMNDLEEFQAFIRVMHAKAECLSVLDELGLR